MTVTYDPALPTTRDQVRTWVGDTNTDPARAKLHDETIDAILVGEPDPFRAAALCADAIAAAYADRVDQSEGGQSATLSQQYEHYKERAATLRARASALGVVPGVIVPGVVGAVGIPQRVSRHAPYFRRGMFGAGPRHPNHLPSSGAELEPGEWEDDRTLYEGPNTVLE